LLSYPFLVFLCSVTAFPWILLALSSSLLLPLTPADFFSVINNGFFSHSSLQSLILLCSSLLTSPFHLFCIIFIKSCVFLLSLSNSLSSHPLHFYHYISPLSLFPLCTFPIGSPTPLMLALLPIFHNQGFQQMALFFQCEELQRVSSIMLVHTYQATHCHIPEDSNCHCSILQSLL